MIKIDISMPKKYEIIIEKGAFNNIVKEIKEVYKGFRLAVITDENLYGLYGEQLRFSLLKESYDLKVIVIKPGESSKSFETLINIYSQLSGFLRRNDLIAAFGGGVVGDLAGFAASTYMRGVKLIQIPTTLLSQIDSSVGGKTAINLPEAKNLVGSFYHPERVIIDPLLLKSLPDKYIIDGLGEAIKYACIKDENLFNELMASKYNINENIEELIYACLNIKKEIVEKDEKDYGLRMLLNFGHTIGHAIEQYFNYAVSHGEAVCIGMYHITKNSQRVGFTKTNTVERLTALLENYNIKYNLPLSTAEIIKFIHSDKKNNSDFINLVLLKEIGNAYIQKVPLDNLYNFINVEQERL
jgi:3-dehydroquinate synthase